jgi:hypothetical protein
MKMHPLQVATSFGIWLNLAFNFYTWYSKEESNVNLTILITTTD